MWSVQKDNSDSLAASFGKSSKWSHGITKCPEGAYARGSSFVPGEHSILYPPGPGKAMNSFPSRKISTESFSRMLVALRIAGRSAPTPSAMLALKDSFVAASSLNFTAMGITAS